MLSQICDKHEIHSVFSEHLSKLYDTEIVLICDDSSSMRARIRDGIGNVTTRWSELKNTVKIILDISTALDRNGVDVYFLNRSPFLNLQDSSQLDSIFDSDPTGATPIVPVLSNILNQPVNTRRLIIIATDGKPTDRDGVENISELKRVLLHSRGPLDYVSIVACSDDDSVLSYLNEWDRQIPNLDVVDDYYSEKAEIQRAQGQNFPFSFGDYVVKALLGSIDPFFDSLDEVPLNSFPTAIPVTTPLPQVITTPTVAIPVYAEPPAPEKTVTFDVDSNINTIRQIESQTSYVNSEHIDPPVVYIDIPKKKNSTKKKSKRRRCVVS